MVGHILDRVGILAARKGTEILDEYIRTIRPIDAIGRYIAAASSCNRVRRDRRQSIAFTVARRHGHAVVRGDVDAAARSEQKASVEEWGRSRGTRLQLEAAAI